MQIKEELIKKIYPKSIIDLYNKKSLYLNIRDKNYLIDFLFIKLFASILIFFLSFIIINRNLIIAILITFIFNYLYNYLKYEKKLIIREKLLEKEAGLFFEVLVLTLKSGKNLHDSLKLASHNIDSTLALEIRECLNELEYGKSLIEALNDYKLNVPSENIRNILDSIIDSYTSGKDMIDSISKEIELLSEKRIYEIKGYINKLPIKISVISVFILIPLMLLLILSPVLLDLLG